MATLLERVAETRNHRRTAETQFCAALASAKPFYSWAQLAQVAGLSVGGVRWLVDKHKKGESRNGTSE